MLPGSSKTNAMNIPSEGLSSSAVSLILEDPFEVATFDLELDNLRGVISCGDKAPEFTEGSDNLRIVGGSGVFSEEAQGGAVGETAFRKLRDGHDCSDDRGQGCDGQNGPDIRDGGHGGGCSTVHSNSAKDTLLRLENMTARVSKNPQQQTIAQAVNFVVYLKYTGQMRKVQDIIEILGWDSATKKYKYRSLAK